VIILEYFPRFGKLHQEKSGNPALPITHLSLLIELLREASPRLHTEEPDVDVHVHIQLLQPLVDVVGLGLVHVHERRGLVNLEPILKISFGLNIFGRIFGWKYRSKFY
jgi:hypothetical protein